MDNNEEMKAKAANGQKLRVAVTKTSAQGQAAQAASPNLMSFSSDENSVWFNGKKYGAWHVNAQSLTGSSSSADIAKVLGEASEENLGKITAFISSGGLFVIMDESWLKYPACPHYDSEKKIFRLKYYKRASDASFVEVTYAFTLNDGNAWSLSKITTPVSPANADKFYSSLGDTVQVPSTVGGIKAGTTVAQLKGKKQNEIIDMLLFPEQQPVVQAPSASISLKNSFKANGIYEVGSTGPVQADFTTGFSRGTCTVAGQAAKNRAGALDSSKSFIYVGGGESNKTLPAKVTLGTMQYNFKAYYGQGDTLLTSWGNKASVSPNPLPAGGLSSGAVYIYGTYPYYCNGASASTSAQDTNFPGAAAPGTKLPLQKWTDTLVGAKFASEASTGTRLVFEFSATKQVTKVEFMNTVSGKWEVFASGNYAVSSSGNKTVQGASVAYKKLTTQGALSGALQLRFTLANASTRMMADEGLDDNMIEAVLKAPAGEAVDGGEAALAADVAGDGIMPVSEDGIMAAAVDTGNRAQGVAPFAVNFEPGGQAPLDARTLVKTKADLVNAKTYAGKNYYKGMMVVVQDTQEVYVLKDVSKVSSSDYSGWKRVDVGGQSKTPVENSLSSTSTTSALSAAMGKKLQDEKLSKTEAEGAYATKSELALHTGNKNNPHGVTKAQVGLSEVTNDAQVKRSEMGKAGGVATLDSGGKVPSAQLPSYVDDVLEVRDFVAGKANIPTSGLTAGWLYYVTGEKKIYRATSATAVDGGSTPETGKIYVTADDNKTYRWSGSDLVEISKSIGLGETAGTAYDGKKGADLKKAYDAHAGNKSNPHGVTKAQVGLSNVTNDAQVKRSEVVDAYGNVKAGASSSTVASTNVTKRIITVQEACAPVMLDLIFTGDVTINSVTTTEEGGSLVYVKQKKRLAYRINGQYYSDWNISQTENQAKLYPDLAGEIKDLVGRTPYEGKVYVVPSSGSFKGVYVCKDGDLVLLSDKTEVINSLTSDRTDAALSAAQGKELKSQVDEKLSKTEASGTYLTKASAEGTYAKKTDLGIVIE